MGPLPRRRLCPSPLHLPPTPTEKDRKVVPALPVGGQLAPVPPTQATGKGVLSKARLRPLFPQISCLLLRLCWEQMPTQDKVKASGKGEAPPGGHREQTQAVVRAAPSVLPQTLQEGPEGGPSKETLGFHCRPPVRPPASSRFSKRPSSPCPGSPRRGAAASEAATEGKAGPELAAGGPFNPSSTATMCGVLGEISLEQRLPLPKKKKKKAWKPQYSREKMEFRV